MFLVFSANLFFHLSTLMNQSINQSHPSIPPISSVDPLYQPLHPSIRPSPKNRQNPQIESNPAKNGD